MKSQILKGTFILSFVGIISRLIGFYYRIFLSTTIGASGMGLYQMIFPVYNLALSFCIAGMQIAISKYAAASKTQKEALSYLKNGLCFALGSSLILCAILTFFCDFIAVTIIGDSRCADLLCIAAYSLPFCCLHSCITGYFLGKQKTGIPALAQFSEQAARVGFVVLFSLYVSDTAFLSPNIAMYGTFTGELASSFVCVSAILLTSLRQPKQPAQSASKNAMRKLFSLSYPITLSRVITGLILSSEAVLILANLRKYGLSQEEALSIYGVFTGMAMPFIFFPSTITGAISATILPSISADQSAKNYVHIAKTTEQVVRYCFSIGIFFAALFCIYGVSIGTAIFDNQDAGVFISILSWLCPFMYLGSTLGSILNGLGLTKITFFINILVSLSRIGFILLFVPNLGIKGLLWGMLASQILSACLLLYFTKKHTHFHYDLRTCLLLPTLYTAASISVSVILNILLKSFLVNELLFLIITVASACATFFLLLFRGVV